MGFLSALDISDEALGIPLETQMSWHLQSNHYPPVPLSMVPVCIEAIDSYNEGHYYVEIELPDGIRYKGSDTAPAWAIVEQHHLDAWIIESELD